MADQKRLIVDALKKYHDAQFTPGVYEHSIFGKAAMLLEADAVEVVRCKDCKHWKYDARKLCGRCDALMCYRPDYFWCMYGERRIDNG